MSVTWRRTNVGGPRIWSWALGMCSLPILVLAGLGPAVGREVGPNQAVVSVVIESDHLQMPDSVTAGAITFEVTNRDSVTRGLAIRKDGNETPVGGLDMPLQPGDARRAQLSLDAGIYHVYCPNGVDRGLIHKVTVTPETSQSELRH